MEESRKKRVAIVLDEATVGGIETALTQMLRKIDTEKYEISLFTNVHGNPCIGQIPKCIKVYDLDDLNLRTHFFRALRKGALFRAGELLRCYIKLRLSKTMFEEIKWSIEPFMLSEEVFDCAISYKNNWKSVFLTMYRVKAKKRIVWMHGKTSGTPRMTSEMLKDIELADKVFSVSADMKEYIDGICPTITDRSEVFYNLLDSEEIVKKAGEGLDLGEEITLVTVGRLSSDKGQDMIPQTVRFLLDAGYHIKWYVVGDGPLREIVEEKCNEYCVTERVALVGTQSNPFPFIKGCNIYVQPSYTEGWGLTVQEAKILHKPIVTTDLPVMREQIVHMKNGYITEGISSEALFEGIKTLIDNPALCEKFAEELKKESHDNSRELEKLYAFIES